MFTIQLCFSFKEAILLIKNNFFCKALFHHYFFVMVRRRKQKFNRRFKPLKGLKPQNPLKRNCVRRERGRSKAEAEFQFNSIAI